MITVWPRRSSWATRRRVWAWSLRRRVPVGAQVVVGLIAFQHPVGRHQDGVRDRDLGPAHPPPFHQPGMLGGQVVLAVHPADRSGGLDQHCGQPFVAVPFPGRGLFPADSSIAGAKPAQAAK